MLYLRQRRMTHAYGPSALQARCGAPNVYCSVYAREVTCEACQRLRGGDKTTVLANGAKVTQRAHVPKRAGTCFDCDAPARWQLHTQFAGTHNYCDAHAPEHGAPNETPDGSFWVRDGEYVAAAEVAKAGAAAMGRAQRKRGKQ